MRHRYSTRAIVLSRAPLGEANALVTLLTEELGLVRARAQGLRGSGAKLASALVTFAESDLVLVRGKEQWRVAGALLSKNWFASFPRASARKRASRVCGLLLRLVTGEAPERALYSVVADFFCALAEADASVEDAAEVLAALSLLSTLGLDTGELPQRGVLFSREALVATARDRTRYVARINHGIAASGL